MLSLIVYVYICNTSATVDSWYRILFQDYSGFLSHTSLLLLLDFTNVVKTSSL